MLTAESRFWSKVNRDGLVPSIRPDLGPCWLWMGGTHGGGYGAFYVPDPERTSGRRQVGAHRFAFELVNGPMSDGLVPDHLCKVVLCVNPTHIEAVTPAENGRRSANWAGLNARKNNCPQGHPYQGANVRINRQGSRECRACLAAKDRRRVRVPTDRSRELSRERARRYRERMRMAGNGSP